MSGVSSIVSTQPIQIPPYAKVDGYQKLPIPYGACDGGGFTAKGPTPEELQQATTNFVGKVANGVKDIFVKKPAKNDASQVSIPAAEKEEKSGKNNKKFLSVAILLIGGALLGYGHRKQIDSVVDSVKGKFAQWTADGTGKKIADGAKNLVTKAKDAIFVKG